MWMTSHNVTNLFFIKSLFSHKNMLHQWKFSQVVYSPRQSVMRILNSYTNCSIIFSFVEYFFLMLSVMHKSIKNCSSKTARIPHWLNFGSYESRSQKGNTKTRANIEKRPKIVCRLECCMAIFGLHITCLKQSFIIDCAFQFEEKKGWTLGRIFSFFYI